MKNAGWTICCRGFQGTSQTNACPSHIQGALWKERHKIKALMKNNRLHNETVKQQSDISKIKLPSSDVKYTSFWLCIPKGLRRNGFLFRGPLLVCSDFPWAEAPQVLAFEPGGLFPIGGKLGSSLCPNMMALKSLMYYSPRTIEILRATWSFFRLAFFQWDEVRRKGGKIAQRENEPRPLSCWF